MNKTASFLSNVWNNSEIILLYAEIKMEQIFPLCCVIDRGEFMKKYARWLTGAHPSCCTIHFEKIDEGIHICDKGRQKNIHSILCYIG